MDTLFPVDPNFGMPAYVQWDSPDQMKYSGRSDRIGRHTPENVIPFQPSWFHNGLPSGLHLWVMEYMQPKEVFVGVRWCDDTPLGFQIRRTDAEGYTARFDLLDPAYYMSCRTGKVLLMERATRKVLKRMLHTVAADGTGDWELEMEYVQRNYRMVFERCPGNLATAMDHINALMHRMTGVGRDVSTSIRGLFQDYGDPSCDKLTPPPIRAAWQVLHDAFQTLGTDKPAPFPADMARYEYLKDRVIAAIMDPANKEWK